MWYYRLGMPQGYKHFSKTRPMLSEHFQPVCDWWKQREESDISKYIPVEDIIAADYNLDFCGFPHDTEGILPPEQFIPKYLNEKAVVSSRIEDVLTRISAALGLEEKRMKASDLRKSILQAAVQGKLVPQDKNDEPALALLKRIQAEKVALVKAGKLKKENPLSPIMEDNVPYDLPEGWVWCHLGDLGDVQSSKRVYTSEFVDNGIPFYRGTEIGALSNGKVSITKYYISEKHYCDLIQHTGKPIIGDMLMPSICPDGRIWIVDTDKPFYFKDGRVLWVRLIANSFNNLYIQQALKARLHNDYSSIASGTTFAELKIFSLKEVAIPLPPLSEQHRIIAKLNELIALCDELEAAEKEQDALEKHLVETLPKSILQAAVQGKLVPQDKNDEPASELLKRVQAEKAALVKAGKLKKEKPLPPITEDEIPYDLPEGWVWCRLGEIGAIIGGATPDSSNPDYYTLPSQGIAWITPADMKYAQDDYISHGRKDITQAGFISCSTMLLPAGSVIFSSRAPIGHIAFAKNAMCTNQGFKSIVPYYFRSASWIFLALKSKIADINSRASGTTFKEVSGSFMEKELIPLPPFVEQQRIVAKVNELMLLCDELKHAYDQPISYNNVTSLPTVDENDVEEEPLQMAAQGKINAQPSPKHTDALQQLQGMMQDE